MSGGDERYGRWLDVVSGLLREPLMALPHDLILRELIDTFHARAGAWNCRDRVGRLEALLWPPKILPEPLMLAWSPRLDEHPLIRWFITTGDPAAQTIGRVPPVLAHPRYAEWREIFGPIGCEEHMAMPLFFHRAVHRSFVLVSQEGDFPDHDLQLARRLQPVLAGVERQAAALSRWRAQVESSEYLTEAVAEAGLTGRELAVLHLLAEGLTAAAIGRRLRISPRTVTKHLEHVYAKLHSSDRLSAVLRAQRLGLLPPPAAEQRRTTDVSDPLAAASL
jgi:DNA-binding CsgD family transcriptional regulator